MPTGVAKGCRPEQEGSEEQHTIFHLHLGFWQLQTSESSLRKSAPKASVSTNAQTHVNMLMRTNTVHAKHEFRSRDQRTGNSATTDPSSESKGAFAISMADQFLRPGTACWRQKYSVRSPARNWPARIPIGGDERPSVKIKPYYKTASAWAARAARYVCRPSRQSVKTFNPAAFNARFSSTEYFGL